MGLPSDRTRCFEPVHQALPLGLAAAWMAVGLFACRLDPAGEVTLYCSVDEPFAREVVAAYALQTGVQVRLKTDTEAGKTTGLVNRIIAERSNPRADVFWSSELFQTIRLARAGLLAEFRPQAEGIPDRYRDPQGRWIAFGLRARVIAYNTRLLKADELPARWRDIADPRHKGRLGVANPLFGTTRGHFAAMLALWGEPEYIGFLKALRETTAGTLIEGNATAARLVGRGELHLCATDTDDVYARQARGEPVDMVFPDMGDGGTLLIPNSVAVLAGAPHPEAARRLAEFIASEQTERMLAGSASRNIPVRPSLRRELEISLPPETSLSFEQIVEAMDRAIELADTHLRS